MAVDRRRLVRRHNPVITSAHPTEVFTVGNGDAALTVDLSGLQSFPDAHRLRPDPLRVPRDGLDALPEQRPRAFDRDDFQIPLQTQSGWGWYETRPTRPLELAEAETTHVTDRGPVPYLDRMGLQRPGDPIAPEFTAGAWFHYNPRRAHLGRLALVRLDHPEPLNPSIIEDALTTLDLWSGRVDADYSVLGHRVQVTTVGDPDADRFAVRVRSSLLADGWGVAWVFDPQPDDLAPFEHPLEEATRWEARSPEDWVARRTVETTTYAVHVATTGVLRELGPDGVVATTDHSELDVVVALRPGPAAFDRTEHPAFIDVLSAAAAWWRGYWEDGSAVDLGDSTDGQAVELERRLVLSQYLLAVNCAGSTPPAETGLTYNSWSGKFHLEMHWWHAAHFALWNRGALLERSLDFYHRSLDAARETARHQGYRGARWPKQTDPSARESPSNIGVFLVWQQPHVIHLLELLHASGRDEAFLRRHYRLVEATATFMADVVVERDGSFTLPPPLIPAQESYLAERETTADPTFELAYWSWALAVANTWRERLGLPEHPWWRRVSDGMRSPTVLDDGTYAAIATPPFLVRKDHPSMLMAYGWLPPTELIDPSIMSATLDSVWEHWDLQSSWGWDYPVMAMTAARLGDLSRAIDGLLMPSPKNVYLNNGHNPQMPGFLSLYLPANGGLLAAMAHLVAAHRDGAELPPGWSIVAEGFESVHAGIPDRGLAASP